MTCPLLLLPFVNCSVREHFLSIWPKLSPVARRAIHWHHCATENGEDKFGFEHSAINGTLCTYDRSFRFSPEADLVVQSNQHDFLHYLLTIHSR